MRGNIESLLRIRGPRDFYGGLALTALALFALWACSDLPGQQGVNLGAGTAPRLFAVLLASLGVLIAIGGLLFEGPKLEGFAVRGPVYVVVGILVFAVTIRGINLSFVGLPVQVPPLGLVAATFLTFIISAFGSTETRRLESLAAAVGMTMFCVVLFALVLRLPFSLCPSFVTFCRW
jgi:putative tricarboxylic transport membrane protein